MSPGAAGPTPKGRVTRQGGGSGESEVRAVCGVREGPVGSGAGRRGDALGRDWERRECPTGRTRATRGEVQGGRRSKLRGRQPGGGEWQPWRSVL